MRLRPASNGNAIKWYWAIRQHEAYHHDCKLLGDGLCGFKKIQYECWNEIEGRWELMPIENGATPEQIKVLESH